MKLWTDSVHSFVITFACLSPRLAKAVFNDTVGVLSVLYTSAAFHLTVSVMEENYSLIFKEF